MFIHRKAISHQVECQSTEMGFVLEPRSEDLFFSL
jgi:hypothetical protein